MNEKTQGNKGKTILQRKKEQKNIKNHKRGDRAAKKSWRNLKAMQTRVGNSLQLQSWLKGRGKEKAQTRTTG
jgi:hypothetical protein